MTKEERRLWYDFLRSYSIRFLRQKVIDNYIVDFYCHEARLIIELDGSQHYEEKGLLKDKIRTQIIENRNLTVIRVPNNEVNRNFRGVCEYIDLFVRNPSTAKNPLATLTRGPLPFRQGALCGPPHFMAREAKLVPDLTQAYKTFKEVII